MTRMTDDRVNTGSAATEADVHDDDELADLLAAELERYATGAVPTVAAPGVPSTRPTVARPAPAMQPLAVPRVSAGSEAAGLPTRAAQPAPPPTRTRLSTTPAAVPSGGASSARVDDPHQRRERRREQGDFARRAAELDQVLRDTAGPRPADADDTGTGSFRRSSGRRSATGPISQQLPATGEIPIRRRTGFRPPSPAVTPPIEPMDRVLLPTGPITLPEPTAVLLDSMIAASTGPVSLPTRPLVVPEQRTAAGPEQHEGVTPQPATAAEPVRPVPAPVTGGYYEEWEQSLRAIGRPRAPWETDADLVPTGGNADLPTVAVPVQSTGPIAETGAVAPPPVHRGAHALPIVPPALAALTAIDPASAAQPDGTAAMSGRSPLTVPADALTGPTPPLPISWLFDRFVPEASPSVASPSVVSSSVASPSAASESATSASAASPSFVQPFEALTEPTAPIAPRDAGTDEPASVPSRRRRSGRRRAAVPEDLGASITGPQLAAQPTYFDADAEGIDEVAVDYPEVSAATTGAIDLPSVEPRPRTAPVLIERVRTALLQLPTVPPSPTGSGPAAIVGRWLGAYASPFVLLLGFGLASAGAGSAGIVAALLGAILVAPAVVRSTGWSATAKDESAMQEVAILGGRSGRVVAGVLVLARLAAAVAIVFGAGSLAGGWVDRTGALGLTASTAAMIGCVVVAVGALIVAALPTRATAVLTLLAAVVGTVATLLIAVFLAAGGSAPATPTASGVAAALVAGFAGVGLLLVLCAPDVARWRTDLARPVVSAVAGGASALAGAVLLAVATVVGVRSGGIGDPVDEFSGALSDATASALAAPILVLLLIASVTLPALVFRSTGAAAARLIGAGRPVRLGTTAAALLATAGALAMLAAGTGTAAGVVAIAGLAGVPVAAWAGLVVLAPANGGSRGATIGLAVAVVAGFVFADGIVPGAGNPILTALGLTASSGLRGGPIVGMLIAAVLGLIAGSIGRRARSGAVEAAAAPADTVEG